MIPEILRLKVEKTMSIREIINVIMINCVIVSFLLVFDLFSTLYMVEEFMILFLIKLKILIKDIKSPIIAK